MSEGHLNTIGGIWSHWQSSVLVLSKMAEIKIIQTARLILDKQDNM